MIHWNAELRKRLQNEGKSRLAIVLRTYFKDECYSAYTIREFMEERRSKIQPPARTTIGEMFKGQTVNIEFPSLKYERLNNGNAMLSDPTGNLEVMVEFLWENSWILPENIPDGSRINRPIVAYWPKQDKSALIHFEDQESIPKSKDLFCIFLGYPWMARCK
jgi:hypothetical protein